MANKIIDIIKKIELLIPQSHQLYLRYFWQRITFKLDDEMFYVNNILGKKRRFLDIGSNVGIYSFFLERNLNLSIVLSQLKKLHID